MNPVFRRTRRVLPFLLAASLGLALASCGDDEGGSSADTTLDSVQVEGEVGTAPEVSFDRQLDATETTTEVVIEGDGAELAAGDQVLTHLWFGNGFTQEKAFSTYDAKKPELVTVDEKQLSPVFLEGIEGQTVGSRVMVAAPASEAFGEQGNPQLGIGNEDTVLVVIDLLSSVLEEPSGESANAPSWAPKIVEKDGVPTGFDFSRGSRSQRRSSAAPSWCAGTAPRSRRARPSWSTTWDRCSAARSRSTTASVEQPTSFQIGVGAVVPGWDKSLVGKKIGSRVVMAVPPEDGYGKQGNPQAGIKGDDTLYFVVDILAAG